MKTLLIRKNINQESLGGRELLSKSNLLSLSSILSDDLEIFELLKLQKSNIQKFLDIPRGHIDGVSDIKIKEILNLISKKNFKIIFLDGSNFGSIAKLIKKNFPELKIIIFFNNL